MPALDTNVLVRYLVADDNKQFQLARSLIENANTDHPLFVALSVVVELESVLRSLYKFDKRTLLTVFNQLLETRELIFQDEDIVEIAINLYSEFSADFADCLHVASAHAYEQTLLYTFDRQAAKITGSALPE